MTPPVDLLVGTSNGAFHLRADSRRRSWKLRGPMLQGWKVLHISADTRGRGTTLYAGIDHTAFGPTIMRSSDWGRTWAQVGTPPRFGRGAPGTLKAVWTIVPGRASEPQTLFAGVADAALFRSTDQGQSWTELKGLQRHPSRPGWSPGNGGLCTHTILLDPRDPKHLSVGISAVGFLDSTDGGRTFSMRNEGLPAVVATKAHPQGSCVHTVVADPTNSRRLYMQNHQGMFRSRDGGERWRRCESGLPGPFGFPLVMHPQDPRSLYSAPLQGDYHRCFPKGRMRLYRTSDGGTSWKPIGKGLPDRHFYGGVLRHALAVDGCDPAGVYVGTTNGHLFGSADEGRTFRRLPGDYNRIMSVRTVPVSS